MNWCNLDTFLLSYLLGSGNRYKDDFQETCREIQRKHSDCLKIARWNAESKVSRISVICFSTAEYANPVWKRSPYAKWILLWTFIFTLSGIAPSVTRWRVQSKSERAKEINDERHPMLGRAATAQGFKSRNCFLNSVEPATKQVKK